MWAAPERPPKRVLAIRAASWASVSDRRRPPEVGVGASDSGVGPHARMRVDEPGQGVAEAAHHHRVVLHRGFRRLGHPAAPSVVALHQRPVEPGAAQSLPHLGVEVDDPRCVGSVQCDVEAGVPPGRAPPQRQHLVADVAFMEIARRQEFVEHRDAAPGVALGSGPHRGQEGGQVPGSDLQQRPQQAMDPVGPAALGHQPVVGVLTRFAGGQPDGRAVEGCLGGVVDEVGRTRRQPAVADLDVLSGHQAPVLTEQADARRTELRDGAENPVHAGGVGPAQRDQQRVDRRGMLDVSRPELSPQLMGERHRVGVTDDDQRHVEPVGEATHTDTELEAGVGDDQRGRTRVGDDADGHVDLVEVLADTGRVEHDRLPGPWRGLGPEPPVEGDLGDHVVQPGPASQQLSGGERGRGQQLSHRGRALVAHDAKPTKGMLRRARCGPTAGWPGRSRACWRWRSGWRGRCRTARRDGRTGSRSRAAPSGRR